MKIPTDAVERNTLFRNLVRECEKSRQERRELHRRMRTTYLNGQDSMELAVYNRILEFVDTSSSYLYDPEGTRLVVECGAEYGDLYLEEEEAASEDLQRAWSRRHTLEAAKMVEWSHVFPSTIAKTFWNRDQVDFWMLDDPADFGVWEETKSIRRQEAMTHHFELPLPAYERLIDSLNLSAEKRDVLIFAGRERAVRSMSSGSTVLPPTQNRIILAAVSPDAIGTATMAPLVSMATPVSDAPVVDMAELWVKDDETGDWTVATLFRPTEEVLFWRNNPQPKIDPFYQLCLFPIAGYIWGLPMIERMIPLQMQHETFMYQLAKLTELNLDPPRAYLGISGINQEKADRLRSPGGAFFQAQPGGDIKDLAPPIPPDAWTYVDGVSKMFNRLGGLPPGADVGAEIPGVRAGDQLETMSTLGSPRTRKRAMYVEAFLNDVATAIVRMWRRTDKRLLKPYARNEDNSPQQFLYAQLPSDITASVAAHSASPLYEERTFERAMLIYQAGAIDDESLVMMSGLPMQKMLRSGARRIMKAKAEQAQKVSSIKTAVEESKIVKNLRK